MELDTALEQIRTWCDESKGTKIELLPGEDAVFESRSLHSSQELSAVEKAIEFTFPDSYRRFMNTIGASSLFSLSTYGGGPRFYTPEEVIKASEGATYRDDEGQVHRFCFVGEHLCMGDFMGFLTSKPDSRNFDVFCHEYPFEEYVAVSNEIDSWRTFEQWLIRSVESRGEDTL